MAQVWKAKPTFRLRYPRRGIIREGDMRMNTPKQTEASRANGSNSTGPKSAEGKQKARLNAVKDGLFSKALVIERLGEQQEDFDNIKDAVWDSFQPVGILEEMLVADYLENWWRRQRVRRAGSADLESRLRTLGTREEVEPATLYAKFILLASNYATAHTASPRHDKREILAQLEEMQEQLTTTFFGLTCLVDMMKDIEEEAASQGQLSATSVAQISACCGFGTERAAAIRMANEVCKKEAKREAEEDSKPQTASDKPKTEEPLETDPKSSPKELLVTAI
jgi:hypothetical protein